MRPPDLPAFTATIALAEFARVVGQRGEGGGVADPLDIEPERGDARIVEQGRAKLGKADLRRVAEAGDIARAAGRGACMVRLMAMFEDWLTSATPRATRPAAVLVGPQQRAVEIVDQSVAVRAEDRHVAGRRDQLGLERGAAGLASKPEAKQTAPPAPIAESPATTAEVASRFTPMKTASGAPGRSSSERKQAVPPSVSRVGCTGQILAGKAHPAALRDDVRRPCRSRSTATERGCKSRSRRPAEAACEASAAMARSSARPMMWRWISLVPSQMRSTRASRQMRSSGSSSISPMPPWIWIASSATRPASRWP